MPGAACVGLPASVMFPPLDCICSSTFCKPEERFCSDPEAVLAELDLALVEGVNGDMPLLAELLLNCAVW